MNKIKEWAKANKVYAIIGGIALFLFIIMLIIGIMLFIGGSNNEYGHRLDGIKDVEISDETKEEVENFTNDKVESSEIRIQGRIIYITINYVNDITKAQAKEIASETLSIFSEEEQDYYDICYFLVQGSNGEEDADTFVITGTKHPSKAAISWTKE